MSLTISPSPFGSLVVSVAETGSTLSVTTVATSPSVLSMALGVPGPAGATGATGAAGTNGTNGTNGVGVPVGGTAGQVLAKINSTNYNTEWVNVASGDFLPLAGGTMSGTIFLPSLRNLLNTNLTVTAYNDTGAGTNYVHTFSASDGTFALATNGGGLKFPDATVQTTAYDPAVLDGYLPIVSQSNIHITREITTPENNDTAGYLNIGSNSTSGQDGCYIKLISNEEGGEISIQTTSSDSFIKFKDDSTQNTAGLPLTGGTLSGSLIISNGGDLSLSGGGIYDAINVSTGQIAFDDGTQQTTAFPPAGGTTSQYITGTGTLVTFPPVGDRYFTTSNSTLTCDSGNGKTMTIGTELSYSRQQDITVSYNNANHMHGTVLTYDSATGVMTFDSNTHSGGGTFSSWEVNVGGVAGAVLPVGGTAGQVLAKINSTNFNTEWISLGTMATQPASAYLSTASAVANYLTISSASSTYQTQSGMSAYLSTASAVANYQTISGMSAYLSTSAASSTYLTQSNASSTYLTQSSAASTYLTQSSAASTYIGTSAYATTAQAQAGTSITTVISPATLFDARWYAGSKSMVQISWSTAVSGAGANAGAQNSNARLNNAPTSNTGYAIASAVIANNSRGTIYNAGFDFSKRVAFGLRVARNVASPDTASVWRFSIGKSSATDASDISARGLQVKVAGSGALQLLVHNGTTLTTTTSSYTPANGVSYDIVVTSDGAGACVLYVNGTSVATSSGGPTTAGATNAGYIMFEVQNTAGITGSPQNICISDYFVQVNS